MLDRPFDAISISDLEALIENQTPEGRQLEFKSDHYGRTDDARREFAADVSAMANSLGGYLLIGVQEERGVATSIVGVTESDPDSLVRSVAHTIRTSIEPPISGVRIRWIDSGTSRGVLVIKVDRSGHAPHRVTVGRDSRFFLRDENGKRPMGIDELRRAFLFASEVENRIRQFRTDRMQLLIANEGPLAVDHTRPRAVLHIVPQATFSDGLLIAFDRNAMGIRPFGGGGWNSMYSLDGIVNYSGPEDRFEVVRAFSTFFRSGPVELVGQIYSGERNGHLSLSLSSLEQDVIQGVQSAFAEMRKYSVAPPYYLMLSLVGVRGYSAPTDEWDRGIPYPHRSDRILLPELTVDDVTANVAPSSFLRPIFNLMWNAFGRSGSPNYDRAGQYSPRR